ncbi:PIN domain-containing protein [Treponema parvum]|uniref:PIN domain-containing protein n=1 Tax=Treponema parvum TaxID=138851 RepID=A0A975F0T0_9SPIR|nr:PIN domain-containing protein [Treponema parvum]QTQ12394.1 PIN domain-containing protein [Treponema parvum]
MVLVDTSVWIEYFRGSARSSVLKELIHNNTLCINNLVLAELLPFINLKKEYALKRLLLAIKRVELEIDWDEIIDMQTRNLSHGINKVGIPDLIIAQNAINNNLFLFSFDKHFGLMRDLFALKIFAGE